MVDFGFAKRLPFGATVLRCTKLVGTEGALAPEQLTQFINSASTDIWQCGVTLFILIFHTYPFQSRKEIMDIPQPYVINCANSEKLSDGGVDLFTKIFTRPPNLRISLPGILNHSWIRGEYVYMSVNEQYTHLILCNPIIISPQHMLLIHMYM